LYHILGDDGDEYPLISYWGGDQGTRVLGGRLIPTYIDDNKAHIFEENTTESSQS
jgi:hypothetical protein